VDIKGGERSGCLAPPLFKRCREGPLFKFRTKLLHCCVEKLINHSRVIYNKPEASHMFVEKRQTLRANILKGASQQLECVGKDQ